MSPTAGTDAPVLLRQTRRRGRWQALLFPFGPLGLTFLIAALQGVLYHDGCGPLRTAALVLGLPHHGPACMEIAFTADLPSLVLGASAVIAARLYWWSEGIWSTLEEDLQDAEVLPVGSRGLFSPGTAFERRLDWIARSVRGRILVGSATVLGGLTFYIITYRGGYLFRDYALSQGFSRRDFGAVRTGWWANWYSHKALALMWIAVGTAGVYAAVLDLVNFLRRTLTLRRLSRSPVWQYVPARRAAGHPWDQLMRLGNVRVWGLVVFLITMAVLVYVARAPHPGGFKNVVLAMIAVGVVVATVVPLRLYYRAVLAAHEASVRRELDILRIVTTVDDYSERNFVMLRRAELLQFGAAPSLSALTSVTRSAAVLVAFAGFLASIYQLLAS